MLFSVWIFKKRLVSIQRILKRINIINIEENYIYICNYENQNKRFEKPQMSHNLMDNAVEIEILNKMTNHLHFSFNLS